jgi:hypothetical protein
LKEFPKNVDTLETVKGSAFLLKTDIFKRIMFFAYRKEYGALDIYPISVDRAKEIIAMNRAGKKPEDLLEEGSEKTNRGRREKGTSDEFVDGAGSLELSQLDQRNRKNKNKKRGPNDNRQDAKRVENRNPNQQQKVQPQTENKVEKKEPVNNQNQNKGEIKEGDNQNRQHKKHKYNRNKNRNRPRNDDKPNDNKA